MRFAARLLLVWVLFGCAPSEPIAPVEPEVVPLPELPAEPPAATGAAAADGFCGALTRIIEAEHDAFAPLRSTPVDQRTWRGRTVPEPFTGCRVQGDYYPGALYVCRSGLAPATMLQGRFADLSSRIDSCLRRPSWYPRDWRRGDVFQFAGAEKQVMWRDVAEQPAPAVTLKIEEDFARARYLLRLAVRTLR